MHVSQDPPNQSLPVADVAGGLSLVDAWNETWGRWSGNPSGVKASFLLTYLSSHYRCIWIRLRECLCLNSFRFGFGAKSRSRTLNWHTQGHRRRLRQQLLNNENQRKLLQWQKQRQRKLQKQRQLERHRQRRLFTVSYPDNPGCSWAVSQVEATAPEDKCYSRSADGPALGEAAFMKIGKYVGAQKTTLGVYLANATWPNTEWTMVKEPHNSGAFAVYAATQ